MVERPRKIHVLHFVVFFLFVCLNFWLNLNYSLPAEIRGKLCLCLTIPIV